MQKRLPAKQRFIRVLITWNCLRSVIKERLPTAQHRCDQPNSQLIISGVMTVPNNLIELSIIQYDFITFP